MVAISCIGDSIQLDLERALDQHFDSAWRAMMSAAQFDRWQPAIGDRQGQPKCRDMPTDQGEGLLRQLPGRPPVYAVVGSSASRYFRTKVHFGEV